MVSNSWRYLIANIVGNNAEQHTLTEIRALLGVVAYNAEKYQHCR
jgi:hypothetical protein